MHSNSDFYYFVWFCWHSKLWNGVENLQGHLSYLWSMVSIRLRNTTGSNVSVANNFHLQTNIIWILLWNIRAAEFLTWETLLYFIQRMFPSHLLSTWPPYCWRCLNLCTRWSPAEQISLRRLIATWPSPMLDVSQPTELTPPQDSIWTWQQLLRLDLPLLMSIYPYFTY